MANIHALLHRDPIAPYQPMCMSQWQENAFCNVACSKPSLNILKLLLTSRDPVFARESTGPLVQLHLSVPKVYQDRLPKVATKLWNYLKKVAMHQFLYNAQAFFYFANDITIEFCKNLMCLQ